MIQLDVEDLEGRPWYGLNWKGYYTTVDGKPVIVINRALRGIMRLRVLFHEFGHHLYHAPETCFFSEDVVERSESEAEVFALVALIPCRMLPRLATWSLFGEDEDLLPVRLLRMRRQIYERYRI